MRNNKIRPSLLQNNRDGLHTRTRIGSYRGCLVNKKDDGFVRNWFMNLLLR